MSTAHPAKPGAGCMGVPPAGAGAWAAHGSGVGLRDGVPAQLPTPWSAHSERAVRPSVLNLALISSGSLMFAIKASALFGACAWGPGTRERYAPSGPFWGAASPWSAATGLPRGPRGSRSGGLRATKRFPSQGRLLGLLTPGSAGRETRSRRTCTGPGRSSPSRPAPSSSRSCSLCRRTSSWGGRDKRHQPGAEATRGAHPARPVPARPGSPRLAPGGSAVLTCCGSPAGSTAGAGWRG